MKLGERARVAAVVDVEVDEVVIVDHNQYEREDNCGEQLLLEDEADTLTTKLVLKPEVFLQNAFRLDMGAPKYAIVYFLSSEVSDVGHAHVS